MLSDRKAECGVGGLFVLWFLSGIYILLFLHQEKRGGRVTNECIFIVPPV